MAAVPQLAADARGPAARPRAGAFRVPRQALIAVKLLIGAALLAFVLHTAGGERVGALLAGADRGLLAGATLLLILAVAINGLRWWLVLSRLEEPIPLPAAMIGTFEGMLFNQILPTSVGGDALRALRAYDRGANGGVAVASVFIDRALGLWFVALLLVVTLAGASALSSTASYHALIALSAVILCGGVGAAAIGRFVRPSAWPSFLRPLATLTRHYARVTTSAPLVAQTMAALLLSNLLTLAAFVSCAWAVGLDVGLIDAVIVLQGATLAALLPVSIGGWGLREGAAVALFSLVGVGAGEAAAATVLFGLALTFVGLVGGAVWMAAPYRRVTRLSALRRPPRALGETLDGAGDVPRPTPG